MASGTQIIAVNFGSSHFQRRFKKLPPNHLKECQQTLGMLTLLDIAKPPARLHLHALTNRLVPSALDPAQKVRVYTFHVTSNDAIKASFTFEAGVAHMRTIGPHDEVDKNP